MFFFLSKTLSYLVKPLFIICICFLVSWLIKNQKWKKRLFVIGVIMLLFFSNEFILNETMLAWEVKVTPFSQVRQYEYGILLCGTAKSGVGPKDRVYLGSGADRINHSLQLYKLGNIKKILISGGSGRIFDIGEREADELASLLKLMGVPPEDIIIENESRNTHESALEVKRILKDITTPDRCILITSAYHMRRSLACFAKVGWRVDPFSTDFQSHDRTFSFDTLLIPKVEALGGWHIILKEWTGCVVYWVMGYA